MCVCVCIHAHCLFVVLPSLKNAWDWFDTNCVGTFLCVLFVLWCEQLYSVLFGARSLFLYGFSVCECTHSPVEVHCIIFADNCCLRKWIVLFSAVKISCFTCCAISGDYHLTKWTHTHTHKQWTHVPIFCMYICTCMYLLKYILSEVVLWIYVIGKMYHTYYLSLMDKQI